MSKKAESKASITRDLVAVENVNVPGYSHGVEAAKYHATTTRWRLKLRQFADGRGELIHYFRENEADPKVVLAEDESLEAGALVATQIMSTLGIGRSQLVEGAYVDVQQDC